MAARTSNFEALTSISEIRRHFVLIKAVNAGVDRSLAAVTLTRSKLYFPSLRDPIAFKNCVRARPSTRPKGSKVTQDTQRYVAQLRQRKPRQEIIYQYPLRNGSCGQLNVTSLYSFELPCQSFNVAPGVLFPLPHPPHVNMHDFFFQ